MIKIPNDTSTLTGSLVEMKDNLITELANKGVTATYDPTTGLLGLISHIADIGAELTLTTNKNILSHYDSETTTLTATHSQGAGKTVEVYNAVSGAKIGDATDNQDGTYSYTYNSTGVGDISMTAVSGQIESNSILIEDIYMYDSLTSAKHSWSIVDNTTNYSYSQNGLSTTGTSGGCYLKFDETLPTDCSIEFTIKGLQNINSGVCGGCGLDNIWIEPHTSNLQFGYVGGSPTTVSQVVTTDDVVKIIRQGTTYNYYVNNDLKYTKTGKPTGNYNYFFIRNVTTTGITIKDLKVKQLTTQ